MKKFDPERVARLNDPARLAILNPDIIWGAIGMPDVRTAVDLGAGTGFFARQIANRMKGGRIHACDTSGEMVDWMRRNLTPLELRVIVPLEVGEDRIDLPDGVADLVYMINVYHELEKPLGTLGEVRRLLKDGGKLVVVDWKKEQMSHGPPFAIRVERDIAFAQMEDCGFTGVEAHDVLPLHYLLVGRIMIRP